MTINIIDTIVNNTIVNNTIDNGGFEPRRVRLARLSKENGGLKRFELDWHYSPIWEKKAYRERRNPLARRKRERGKPRYKG